MSFNWDEFQTRLLNVMDIEKAYTEMGLQVAANASASSSGWLPCHAFGRDDTKPSAAIGVGVNGFRGKYTDLGSGDRMISLWQFGEVSGKFPKWYACREHFAREYDMHREMPKIKDPKENGKPPIEMRVKLKHQATSDQLLSTMGQLVANRYPGVTVDAMKLCGARIAEFGLTQVVAFPAFGPELLNGPPVSYVCLPTLDKTIPVDAKGTREGKVTVGGSGLVGLCGLKNLEQADVVVKVEGITDLLTLQGIIPQQLLSRFSIITNSCGAGEKGSPKEFAHLFAGKKFMIIHDNDEAGQKGAQLWMNSVGHFACEVQNVVLPYTHNKNKGHDLRDFLIGAKDKYAT